MVNLSTLILLTGFVILTLTDAVDPPTFKYLIFTNQCYDIFFTKMDFFHEECLQLTISKFLGYGLVAGGAIVKIPQVIKIVIDKSTYGISFQSIVLEALTNWVTIVYSWYKVNPFSIYGQNNIIIMLFFILFSKNRIKFTVALIVFLGIIALTSNPMNWPADLINGTMYLQMILFSSARIAQIYEIWKNQSTGSLSLITCLLIFVGNLARLYTITIEADGDWLFKLSVILAAILNGFIVFQFILYWKNASKEKKE